MYQFILIFLVKYCYEREYSMSKTLVLIDGHALAYRQYFALERTAMKNSANQPTWAVYGFFKSVFDLLTRIKPDFIAVAFDVSRHTLHRTEMYSEYKAQREAMPDTLHSQIGLIIEGLQAFDIPIYTKEGFEADDVIGTISKIATENGDKTYILTGDQDSFQLVDREGNVTILIPSKGELIEYNWDKVYEKLGVYPNQVIDYKGLRGDTSDNIPGIKGIGEKTAQKLLSRYPNLEALLADCENIPENAVREKICTQKEIAILSKELATIIRNVELDVDVMKASVTLPDIQKVSDFLRKMQFYTFIKNIDKILSSFSGENVSESENLSLFKQDTVNAENVQQSLFTQAIKETVEASDFEYTVVNADNVKTVVFELEKAKHISLRLDIRDEKLNGIAISNGETYYFGDNFLEILKPIINSGSIKKLYYDAKTDFHIFKNN